MLNTLEKLCSLPGVSGSEEEVRRYIRSEALKYTDDVYTDVMGSLIVTKRGKNKNAPHLMLAAHMDEVGFMVKSITEPGTTWAGVPARKVSDCNSHNNLSPLLNLE